MLIHEFQIWCLKWFQLAVLKAILFQFWSHSPYFSRALKYAKNSFCHSTTFFHAYLMRGLQKNAKNKIFTVAFFKSTLFVLRSTWTDRINLKIFLGHDINYLSIWHSILYPWFLSRKVSKLTFVCFQLQLFSTMQAEKLELKTDKC